MLLLSNLILTSQPMLKDIKPKTLLIILLVIAVPITLYIFLNKNKGIDNIKEHIKTVIPNKYEVIEEDKEGNDGCTILYTIYPKEYTELEKKYLTSSTIRYCKDMKNVSFKSQVGSVEYNKEKDIWFFVDGDYRSAYEKVMFGEREVTIAESFGSHLDANLYITRVGDSDEIIVFHIPNANRIRCEEYDNEGTETWNKDCVELLATMGIHDAGNGWVPGEIYENDYKELVEILKDI